HFYLLMPGLYIPPLCRGVCSVSTRHGLYTSGYQIDTSFQGQEWLFHPSHAVFPMLNNGWQGWDSLTLLQLLQDYLILPVRPCICCPEEQSCKYAPCLNPRPGGPNSRIVPIGDEQ